jgi:hypothetical protein
LSGSRSFECDYRQSHSWYGDFCLFAVSEFQLARVRDLGTHTVLRTEAAAMQDSEPSRADEVDARALSAWNGEERVVTRNTTPDVDIVPR